jgi:hypothetical protein
VSGSQSTRSVVPSRQYRHSITVVPRRDGHVGPPEVIGRSQLPGVHKDYRSTMRCHGSPGLMQQLHAILFGEICSCRRGFSVRPDFCSRCALAPSGLDVSARVPPFSDPPIFRIVAYSSSLIDCDNVHRDGRRCAELKRKRWLVFLCGYLANLRLHFKQPVETNGFNRQHDPASDAGFDACFRFVSNPGYNADNRAPRRLHASLRIAQETIRQVHRDIVSSRKTD